MRTRTRRSVAAAFCGARVSAVTVSISGRHHERTQLRDGPAPVHDLQDAAQRRIGERHRRGRRQWVAGHWTLHGPKAPGGTPMQRCR